jgi:translation initiation factor IF-3
MQTKVDHAVDFLCEDMKVKVSLRFRGREMAHKEIGFDVMQQFVDKISAYGQPDFQPKLNGRHINLMISPLAKSKRAPHPKQSDQAEPSAPAEPAKPTGRPAEAEQAAQTPQEAEGTGGFANNPFPNLEVREG